MAGRTYILIWHNPGGTRQRYKLEARTWIGRPGGFRLKSQGLNPYSVILYREDNSEYIETGYIDSTVSRRHATLQPSTNGVIVRDVGTKGKGSLNGTYINGKKIPPLEDVVAKPGDIITVGAQSTFKIGILAEDVVVEPTRPGEILVLDASRARLTRDLYMRSVRLEDGRIMIVAPRGAGASFDADDGHRININGRGVSTSEYKRSLLLSIENMLKDAVFILDEEPPDLERVEEAAQNVKAILALQEASRVLVEIVDRQIINDISSIADLVIKGRHNQAQLKRLRKEISTLIKAIELVLKSL